MSRLRKWRVLGYVVAWLLLLVALLPAAPAASDSDDGDAVYAMQWLLVAVPVTVGVLLAGIVVELALRSRRPS